MKVSFETERLIIRPLVPDDAEAAFRWCGDPNVNTYMIYPLYHRAEDVRAWLESRDADDPDNYDEGICLKSTGELIGSGGMRYCPERGAWEIGYNLRADQWGNGYTGEYLTALLEVIRKDRQVEAIDGIFAAENSKSRRVMEKIGMQEGFDVGLEMSGSPVALNSMIHNMKHGGNIALLGLQETDTVVDLETVIFNGLNIKGIYGRKVWDTWYKMTTMLQAGLKIDDIITHHFDARDYEKGFAAMISGQSGKVILDWTHINEEKPE